MIPHLDYAQAMLTAAEAAERSPAWVDYAHYCRNRERGLRREALVRLNEFIRTAETWPFEQRREFTAWLSGLLETPGWEHYDLAPYPLVTQLLRPALYEWLERQPTSPLPHRWLGMFFADYPFNINVVTAGLAPAPPTAAEHLRCALALDATEQPARVRLASLLIGWLDYDAHELPGFYLGDPSADIGTAEEAARIIDGIADSPIREGMRAELAIVRGRLDDWVAFRAEGGRDFAEWCRLRGRSYRWCQAYYYKA
jgi:hypothetical protein